MGEATGGVLRRGRDRLIGGVCSGLAAGWHLDALLVRIAAVVLLFVPTVGPLIVLLYVVLWLAMPPPDGWEGGGPALDARVRLAAEELRQDFRATFQRAQPPPGAEGGSAPTGTTPAPGRSSGGGWWPGARRPTGGVWLGAILILVGLYVLGDNLGWLSAVRWDLFWPIVIIALGALILLRRLR